MHGHGLFGLVGIGVHFILAGAFFYFLFHITRSLKRIAIHLESKKIG
ncbi:hypothetical protein Ga0466249_002507 [Sporomusaceae bacterium BoRhaA]|nr:hypothetical protein [Pelorhabdus rhamnosifermentans]